MNEIKIFENESFGQLRTLTIDDEPWFGGKDVADVLGYSNGRDALSKHVDPDDKADVAIHDGSQNRNMTVINESGLYSLIFSSKLRTAKEFKRWVTSEVLPSIRKTGGYLAGQETLSDDDLLAKALEVAHRKIAERERRIAVVEEENQRLVEVNAIQEQRINQMRPKETYFDRVMSCKDPLMTKTIAKDYRWSAQTLNNWLHEHGIQFKQNGVWHLYQRYANKGYTVYRTYMTYDRYGNPHSWVYMMWTPSGRYFIYEQLKKEGIIPNIEKYNSEEYEEDFEESFENEFEDKIPF